jgi:hypothetical protein
MCFRTFFCVITTADVWLLCVNFVSWLYICIFHMCGERADLSTPCKHHRSAYAWTIFVEQNRKLFLAVHGE